MDQARNTLLQIHPLVCSMRASVVIAPAAILDRPPTFAGFRIVFKGRAVAARICLADPQGHRLDRLQCVTAP
jgi:hypothetical protein